MLKTRVTLRDISRVLLNLINICHVLRLLLPPNVYAVNIYIFSLVHQLRLLPTLTFVPLPHLFGSVMILTFNWEEFIYGTFEDCIGICNTRY